MQWSEVLASSNLQNFPYKIELNQLGKIEISPASNKQGWLQSKLVGLMATFLPNGESITECAIQTTQGVKVADVVWGSHHFFQQHPLEQDPFNHAPEICVEIVSPSNSALEMQQKIQLYLACGAQEVWLVDLQGNYQFFTASGQQVHTAFTIPDSAWQVLQKPLF